jgi:hypothetical protein
LNSNAAGAGLALLLVALLPHGVAAQAPEGSTQGSESDWTATILEEDDFWSPHNRDRHYTHGIRFSATSGEADGVWQRPFICPSGPRS